MYQACESSHHAKDPPGLLLALFPVHNRTAPWRQHGCESPLLLLTHDTAHKVAPAGYRKYSRSATIEKLIR